MSFFNPDKLGISLVKIFAVLFIVLAIVIIVLLSF